jgi:hypothetical protein
MGRNLRVGKAMWRVFTRPPRDRLDERRITERLKAERLKAQRLKAERLKAERLKTERRDQRRWTRSPGSRRTWRVRSPASLAWHASMGLTALALCPVCN